MEGWRGGRCEEEEEGVSRGLQVVTEALGLLQDESVSKCITV